MEINDIVEMHIDRVQYKDNLAWEEGHRGKLAVSDIGHCPRKAMLRFMGVKETNPFDTYVKRLLWSGKTAEEKLERALRSVYGEDLQAQVRVENDAWTGTVDFLVPGKVIEHKETSSKNFRYNRLPYDFHLLQVLMYRRMLVDQGIVPIYTEAVLYYQLRAEWAEFKVWESGKFIYYRGEVVGKSREGELDTHIEIERRNLEKWFEAGIVPDRYETPFERNFECCSLYSKVAYPSCVYFDLCFPEHAGKTNLTIPEEPGD